MRYVLAMVSTLVFTLAPAHARENLRLSHLQHVYAGGGGCAERFWLDWSGSKEILDIEIRADVLSEKLGPMAVTLIVDRLGVATSDHATETSAETPSCPEGTPRIAVRSATARIDGKPVDLIKNHIIGIGKVARLPISIADPTHRSTQMRKHAMN